MTLVRRAPDDRRGDPEAAAQPAGDGLAFALLSIVGVVADLRLHPRSSTPPTRRRTARPAASRLRARAFGRWACIFGALTAVLIGTEAGTADLSSGVFRDLVATGRSRLALFSVRAPAAVAATLAFTGGGFVLALAATFVFAGAQPDAGVSRDPPVAGWVALANAMLAWPGGRGGFADRLARAGLTAVIGWQQWWPILLVAERLLARARRATALLTGALSN